MKGLHCSILKDSGSRYDCTNGGVTSQADSVTLIGDGVSGPFEPCDISPALVLEYDLDPKGAAGGYLMVANVSWLKKLGLDDGPSGSFACFSEDWSKRHQIVRVRAVPLVDGKPKCGMFGGNFISSSWLSVRQASRVSPACAKATVITASSSSITRTDGEVAKYQTNVIKMV